MIVIMKMIMNNDNYDQHDRNHDDPEHWNMTAWKWWQDDDDRHHDGNHDDHEHLIAWKRWRDEWVLNYVLHLYWCMMIVIMMMFMMMMMIIIMTKTMMIMNIKQLGSDDGMSEYGDDRGSEDLSLWQVWNLFFFFDGGDIDDEDLDGGVIDDYDFNGDEELFFFDWII